MGKSTINLSDVLTSLKSPMEKTAEMKDGKTDDMENKDADAGVETKAVVKDEKKSEDEIQ